jgi:hypothetical protein
MTRGWRRQTLRYHKYLLLSLYHLLLWCVVSISTRITAMVVARHQAASTVLSLWQMQVKMEAIACNGQEGTLSHLTFPSFPTTWWPP